ncbi:MAG: transglycosylase SLT domain-containing protein [Aquificae bacterium]|nr:transglycosylase SLT domain-containing protein [Aquificota bacterium]
MKALLLLLLVSVGLAVNLSEKYELYKKFLKTKDERLGRELLKRYPDAPFRDELILTLAELLSKSKPAEARRLILKARLRRLPAKRVVKLWRRLKLPERRLVLTYPELFPSKVLKLRLSPAERERLARRLFKKRKYRLVLKLSRDCYLRGVSYYRTGRKEKGLRLLEGCGREKAKEFLLYAYLSLKRYGSLDALLKKEQSPRLYFLAGRELLERGLPERAKKYLERSGVNEAVFYLGLYHYLKGEYEKAYERFSAYAGKESKRRFWLFKSALAAGKKDEALKQLTLAARFDDFYGAVAKKLLGLPVYKEVKLEGRPRLFYELKRIRELGFPHYARVEAFRHERLVSVGDVLRLKEVDPYLAIRLAVRRFGVSSPVYKAVSHPTPYGGIVRQVSRRFGVPPALIYAVMRQESLFDPYAVSPAGAKGLMQLMDFTARWKARRLGYRYRSVFDPFTNVYLGTAYLRFLLDYWDGNLVKAVASYNAGHGAVSRWRGYDDEFLFIELIPYNETRKYVKRVLYNYYLYDEKLNGSRRKTARSE